MFNSEDSLKMKWYKYPFEIDGNRIVIKYDETSEHYYPFMVYSDNTKAPVYLQFVMLDTSNTKEISDFIKEYGPLGINRKNETPIDYSKNPAEAALDSLVKGYYVESIDDFKKAKFDLSSFFVILFSSGDPKYFDAGLETMRIIDERRYEILANESKKRGKPISFSLFRGFAIGLIEDILNEKLKEIRPVIKCDMNTGAFKASWNANNLLIAMYAMIYIDLTNGYKYRKCASETCKRFFTVTSTDNKSKFCDDSCKQAQIQREYRRRKKKIGKECE